MGLSGIYAGAGEYGDKIYLFAVCAEYGVYGSVDGSVAAYDD